MKRSGPDNPTSCTACNDPIYPSQVTKTYTTAERMFWFVGGLCKACQRKDAEGKTDLTRDAGGEVWPSDDRGK